MHKQPSHSTLSTVPAGSEIIPLPYPSVALQLDVVGTQVMQLKMTTQNELSQPMINGLCSYSTFIII